MVSQPYKDLISDGAWARDGQRETPESEGLTRANGFPISYEQIGSGDHPQHDVFNQRDFELDSSLLDIAAAGIPEWDAEVDHTPTSDAACFVITASGLWLTFENTGPAYGNATDPDLANQQIWRRY